MGLFRRNQAQSAPPIDGELTTPPHQSTEKRNRQSVLPTHNQNGNRVEKKIQPAGESGRRGISPLLFLRICFRSSCKASLALNVLWPMVPPAIAVYFVYDQSEEPRRHLLIFILNYIAMVPSANLLGFAAQELARKIPKVLGVLMETAFGSVVEIILFAVLITRSGEGSHNLVPVIQAAILGSILANLLLCLGLCFFAGGMTRHEQSFDEAVSEVGSGLLLVAGLGLLVPSAFWAASFGNVNTPIEILRNDVLKISRVTAILLLVAFGFYLWFNIRSHHGIYDAILERDEHKDEDREKDLAKDKLTLTECVIALVIALTCVSLHAVSLVYQIEWIVSDYGVNDNFMGLILVPIVEKAAEHLTAIDEAWDNQMNFALAHILGSTIQTALFNAPLVVIIGWGLHKSMDLQFEVFFIAILIVSIIVVGNFLRDGKSNYLEGALCVIVYIIIAVSTFYYHSTNPEEGGPESATAEAAGGGGGHKMMFI